MYTCNLINYSSSVKQFLTDQECYGNLSYCAQRNSDTYYSKKFERIGAAIKNRELMSFRCADDDEGVLFALRSASNQTTDRQSLIDHVQRFRVYADDQGPH